MSYRIDFYVNRCCVIVDLKGGRSIPKHYTRHQSLKHIWYQRYNSRSSSRYDGVVLKEKNEL